MVADVPRLQCPEHGTQTVQVPWAEKHSRFTLLFERLAIDVLLEYSIRGACDILRVSWDEADGLKQRAVRRGLARKPARVLRRVYVEEKNVGTRLGFVTAVSCLDGPKATLEFIGDGRGRDTLDQFWLGRSDAQRAGVEAVGRDLWAPYFYSTVTHVPDARRKIVHDPFHLERYMNEAVDDVRKAEHRRLHAQANDTLKGSHHLWLFGQENLPRKYRQPFAALRRTALQTVRAWSFKELFRSFWQCDGVADARAFFADWYRRALRSRLAPVKKVARMFQRHLENILTCFQHGLTNAAAEGLNNKIQSVRKKAYGFRNRARLYADLYFHCGGLDLQPALPQ